MGCNSSKGIEVGNGNKEGWNNLPLMRSLSRSFSMPLGQSFKPASSSFDLNGHGFHAVALTSSTYGVLRMPDSKQQEKLYDEASAASSKLGDEGPGEVIDPPPSFKPKVCERDVIDVWELMEDLKEQEGPSVKRRRRTKAYSKSASLPHLHVAKSSVRRFFSGIEEEGHGLPLVLEQSSSGSPRRVLPGSRLSKNQSLEEEGSSSSGSGRPPLAPPAPSSSSSLRKGLFYGASLSLKQDAIVERRVSAGNEKEQVLGRRSSVEASGYCTPYENFGSPSELSCPGSPVCSAIDDDGWCLVGGRREVFVDARSSFRSASGRDESFAMNDAICADGFPRDSTSKVKDAKKVLFSKVSPAAAEVEKRPSVSLLESFERKCPPGGEDRVVFYFTSLQGIRKTYEQCKSVRMVLEGFFTRIDERDVSMHSEFRQEVKKLVGSLPVPRLFIKGRYIGGAEEVLQLNENGLIGQLLEGIPKQVLRKVCEGCGGMRFIPCMECSGSCKLVGDDNQVVRCSDCNENGLVRCPICY